MNFCTAAEYGFRHDQSGGEEFEHHRIAFENTRKTYLGLIPYVAERLDLYEGFRVLNVVAFISEPVS